jgi:molecular chaperone HscC
MIIGIDLGTTNSLVACIENGEATIIPNAHGRNLTPSVVGMDNDKQVIVGEAARQRLTTHEDRTIASFKRYMGTDHVFRLGKQKFRAEELSALLLGSLKSDAESYLGQEVRQAVISVPAYFNDAQRKATKVAGELAGLEVCRLINEPTAAAIAYGLHEKLDESTFMVFDLGGGTFDISILELFDGVMQVHACAGDNYLGGEDFTDAIARHFLDEHGLSAKKLKPGEYANLRRLAENCKFSLSKGNDVLMKLDVKGTAYETLMNASSFESLVEPLLARLRTPIQNALRDANIAASELDSVVMVGGACRMPMIRSNLSRMLSKLPHSTIDYDQTIALGTAIQAGLIDSDETLEEIVLTDVMPYSLGISVHNDNSSDPADLLFSPIIERNSPVPVSRVDYFYPVDERQKKIEFGIYQGEARHVRDNVKLGSVNIPVVPGSIESNQVDVRFTFDLNGILEVEIQKDKLQRRLIIEGNPGVLSKGEIDKSFAKLAGLKIHPREQAENAAALNRAYRLYEQHIGEDRDHIGRLVTYFEGILAGQNVQEIETLRAQFEERLDEFDDDPLSR